MPDLIVSATVTRAELLLPDLELESIAYRVITYGPGGTTHRSQFAESQWVPGSYLTSSVREGARKGSTMPTALQHRDSITKIVRTFSSSLG